MPGLRHAGWQRWQPAGWRGVVPAVSRVVILPCRARLQQILEPGISVVYQDHHSHHDDDQHPEEH